MTEPGGTGLPRVLVVMGSGETSPTMVKTHRALLDRLGPAPVPAVLMDTPFGFQENADDITAKALHYFSESVGASLDVARLRSEEDRADTVGYERSLARVRQARYVFAGPGSPSYALDQWAGTDVPGILADKLRGGGCVTFASAAALTLGMVTVPVYEIYKVGAKPHWLEGLDLLAHTGLRAAVIPHYNNAEGGNHDTRFCYLGERRLAMMETELPPDAFVLGVDEHTGCLLDLDAGTATVVGLGVVTVRARGCSQEIGSGTTLAISDLAGMAAGLRAGPRAGGAADVEAGATGPESDPVGYAASAGPGLAAPGALARSPLLDAVATRQREFDSARDRRDADGAVGAVLGLDSDLAAWAADTLQSDEMDRGRAALRTMIVQLGELAATGLQDPREVLGPYVELVLGLRRAAREERRFSDADTLRDGLVALGVDVMDSPEGTTWELQ